MYYQLGNVRFEGLKGLTGYDVTEAARYGEIAVFGGKSRLQKTGDELTTINIEARFHVGFTGVSPDDDLLELRQKMANGEALAFVNGAGDLIGNFVITSINPTPEIVSPSGVNISTLVSISLREFVDPAPATTAARALQSAGFATDARKVLAVVISKIGSTADAITSASVRSTSINSLSAIADVRSAEANPASQASIFARAAAKIDAATNDAQKAIEKIEQTASIAAKAPALLATMQNVYNNIVIFAQKIEDGDLTNALAQATTLNESVDNVGASLLPLDVSIILREP